MLGTERKEEYGTVSNLSLLPVSRSPGRWVLLFKGFLCLLSFMTTYFQFLFGIGGSTEKVCHGKLWVPLLYFLSPSFPGGDSDIVEKNVGSEPLLYHTAT